MISYYRNTKTSRVISSTGPMYKKMRKEGVELILLPATTKAEAVKVNHANFYVKKQINYKVPEPKKFFNISSKRIVKEGSRRFLETPKSLLRPLWVEGQEVLPKKTRKDKVLHKKPVKKSGKIDFIPEAGSLKEIREIPNFDFHGGELPYLKELTLLTPRQRAIDALPAVKSVIMQRKTVVTFPMYGPDGSVRFYSIPVLRLIRVGTHKWDDEYAIETLTKFYNSPGTFKANHILDVEKYLEEKRGLKGEVQYQSFEGFDPDGRPLEAKEEEYPYSAEDMNAAFGDMFGGDYGVRLKKNYVLYDQVNKEKVAGSCFYNSMCHYGKKCSSLLNVTKKDQVVGWLNRSNYDYIIYEDFIKPDRSSITKLVKPNSACVKTFKGRESVYYELEFPEKILFSKITKDSGRTPLILAITYNSGSSKIDHIYVPNMTADQRLYTSETYHNIYREINGKMVSIMSVLQKNEYNYIYYDLETVSDYKNKRYFRPISMSICSVKLSGPLLHKKTEEEIISHLKYGQETAFIIEAGSNDSKLNEITGAKIVEKLDVWNELKDYLDPDAINKICSFNGANFDNVFLLQSIFANKIHVTVNVSGGRVEVRNVPTATTRFETYDLARFVGPGSLEMHCNNYIKNMNYRKKGMKEIFGKLDKMYDCGIVTDDGEFMQELMKYNDLDVESLAILHCNFLRAFDQILGSQGGPKMERGFGGCISLPQFMYKLFNASNVGKDTPQKFKVPKGVNWKKCDMSKGEDDKWILGGRRADDEEEELTEEKRVREAEIIEKNMDILKEYEVLRQKKTGGRCECVPGKYIDKDYNCRSLDVASLYPFAMLCYNKSHFMIGDLKRTSTYKEGLPGVYIGTVTQVRTPEQQTLFYCDKTDGGNDWNCWDRPITALMTSIDIEEVIRKNPAWSMTIDFGYYTDKSRGGDEVFSCLIPFMQEKTRQDVLSSKKDPNANPALRNVCKVAMNSLSGKFLQSLARFEYEVSEGLMPVVDDEIEKFYSLTRKKYSETSYLCSSLHADKRLHVGVFIYSLSKLYMYQNVYGCLGRADFVYTDTDSSKIMSDEVFNRWMELRGNTNMSEYLHPSVYKMGLGYTPDTKMFYNKIGTKCVGQLEDENHGMGYNKAIYCEKKEYMTWNSETFDHKIMMKGVNLKNFVCLEYNDIIGLGGRTPLNIYYRQSRTGKKFTVTEYEADPELNCSLVCEINPECYDDSTLFDRLDELMGEAVSKRTKQQKVEQVAKMFDKRMTAKALLTNDMALVEQKRIRQLAKTFILMKVFRRNLMSCRIRVEYVIKKL